MLTTPEFPAAATIESTEEAARLCKLAEGQAWAQTDFRAAHAWRETADSYRARWRELMRRENPEVTRWWKLEP